LDYAKRAKLDRGECRGVFVDQKTRKPQRETVKIGQKIKVCAVCKNKTEVKTASKDDFINRRKSINQKPVGFSSPRLKFEIRGILVLGE